MLQLFHLLDELRFHFDLDTAVAMTFIFHTLGLQRVHEFDSASARHDALGLWEPQRLFSRRVRRLRLYGYWSLRRRILLEH